VEGLGLVMDREIWEGTRGYLLGGRLGKEGDGAERVGFRCRKVVGAVEQALAALNRGEIEAAEAFLRAGLAEVQSHLDPDSRRLSPRDGSRTRIGEPLTFERGLTLGPACTYPLALSEDLEAGGIDNQAGALAIR